MERTGDDAATAARVQGAEEAEGSWGSLPAELVVALLEAALAAGGARAALAAAGACRRWRAAAAGDGLWRRALVRDFSLPACACAALRRRAAAGHAHLARGEYRRAAARWRPARLQGAHAAPLTHVSAEPRGRRVCTTARDGDLVIWEECDEQWCERWRAEVRSLGWWHALDTRWAAAEEGGAARLLVCGALRADAAASRGELAAYEVDEGGEVCLRSRVGLRPTAARGAWWDAGGRRVLSAELHYFGRSASCSTLWLSSAQQESSSELSPVMVQLCRVFNEAGSVPRNIEVCEVMRRAVEENDRDRLVELWLDCEREERPRHRYCHHYYSAPDHLRSEGGKADASCERLVIYAAGFETAESHALFFLYVAADVWPEETRAQDSLAERVRAHRLRRESERAAAEREADADADADAEAGARAGADAEAVRAGCARPHRVIDLRGHVVGLTIDADREMLYACVHRWRSECGESSEGEAEAVERCVSVCAVSVRLLRVVWRAPAGAHSCCALPATPGRVAAVPRLRARHLLHYIYPDTSHHYIASPCGAGSGRVLLWSRASGALARAVLLQASPAVAVALVARGAPAPTHRLLVTGEDGALTEWRSSACFVDDEEGEEIPADVTIEC